MVVQDPASTSHSVLATRYTEVSRNQEVALDKVAHQRDFRLRRGTDWVLEIRHCWVDHPYYCKAPMPALRPDRPNSA